jgi:hypothetical protein
VLDDIPLSQKNHVEQQEIAQFLILEGFRL